jgi:phosphatidylethanolamine/phosphatidyl-N-methylethanolamine N-methyltransferase
MSGGLSTIDAGAVRRAYARWAPMYDVVFGSLVDPGRRQAVEHINARYGRVLEVGVGTGVSLPHYRHDLKISAIDLSPEMLARAEKRVARHKLDNVEEVAEMDAADLTYEAGRFDVVVAMYVLTVVPDPEQVMAELERVCAPGGEVLIISHFSQEEGLRGWTERKLAPLASALGWRPDFPKEAVMTRPGLRLVEERRLQPFGLFTMLRFAREGEWTGGGAGK